MRRLLLLLLLAGCAGTATLRLDRADIVGTTWLEVCPSPSIVDAYVRLDPDGRMAWSYAHPDSVQAEDVHTWAVEDGALLLRWNQGGATSRYRPGPSPGTLVADSSSFCVDALPRLDRVR